MTDLDLDRMAAAINAAGYPAFVEQTGGGTATLLIGRAYQEPNGEPDDLRYPLLAGPGWFTGPNFTKGRASAAEFFIGPDDHGVSDVHETDPDDTEDVIVAYIIASLRNGSQQDDTI